MSAYDNDDRVTYLGADTYEIELPGIPGLPGSQDGRVQPSPSNFTFEAFMLTDNPIRREFRSADDAIRSLIGEPR